MTVSARVPQHILLPPLPKDGLGQVRDLGRFQTQICDPKGRTETLGARRDRRCQCSVARFEPAGSGGCGQRLNPCTKLPKVFLGRKKLRVKVSSMHSCGHWMRVLTQFQPGHPLLP